MELYILFARILDAPGTSLSDQVNECVSILAPSQNEKMVPEMVEQL
jgi:hypothetical protein